MKSAVEGATALEESWYVTPPACFTWAGPVNVETSPLEDLLIEHPSMSVYRATASPVAPDTPPPTPDEPEARDAEEDALIPAVSAKTKGRRVQEDVRTPVAFAKTKGRRVQEGARTPVASVKTKERDVKEHISNRAVTAALERSPGRTENDQQSRRPAIHDGRPAVGRVRTEKRIIQLRSAQKVFTLLRFQGYRLGWRRVLDNVVVEGVGASKSVGGFRLLYTVGVCAKRK